MAVAGVFTQIPHLFGSVSAGVMTFLVLMGLLLLLGLIGYVIGFRSLKHSEQASGSQVFFYGLLAVVHLLGSVLYWLLCVAMLLG